MEETSGPTAFLPNEAKSPKLHSTESADGARFTAGTMLADRYRIIGLLGRGGMGEVYKAEDLKLKQVVALKFLPEAVAMDGVALARFQNEVRITRQISHPNVCRVYDIGEADGSHFLSMEFIDGEDLSLLLRRIGRLPGDKANEIARQICAGLAAAHDNNVLHRDLKPANIMIDGRGRARITDFGVAVAANELLGREAAAGTAAYMAPEQLKGKEVTQRSDIYSLGLVLYELFTGKRVYDSDNLAELIRLHESSTPTNPSDHVQNIDPLVERVILRCLEKDPNKRPGTAIQVAAALPGGDPLAAALAAGETPSPQMVAESGGEGALRPAVAMYLLTGVISGLIFFAIVDSKVNWPAKLLHDNSPDTLTHKAKDIIERLGYTDRPADTAAGIYDDLSYRQYFGNGSARDRWNEFLDTHPGPIVFWYRQSPRPLNAQKWFNFGYVWEDDPPGNQVSGMVSVRMDPDGRVFGLTAVPRQVDQPANIPGEPDWSVLFTAAGLDQTAFSATESTWTPTTAFDKRVAWTGAFSNRPDIPIRIEAASYRGKVVYFDVIPPWRNPWMVEPFEQAAAWRIASYIFLTIVVLVVLGALWLARKNVRMGRGDRRGAYRVASFAFSLVILYWLFGASHHASFDDVQEFFFLAVSRGLLAAGVIWLLYIALEPYVRRRWPDMLISWSRLVGGDVRDALIGRDVLIGTLLGVMSALIPTSESLISSWIGGTPVLFSDLWPWLDFRRSIAGGLQTLLNSGILVNLSFLLIIFILRVLTRRQLLTGVIIVGVFGILPSLQSSEPLITFLTYVLSYTLWVIALLRFGLLATVVMGFVTGLLFSVPITTDPFAWYSGQCFLGLGIVLALAAYAFHFSLGGQKMHIGNLLEE